MPVTPDYVQKKVPSAHPFPRELMVFLVIFALALVAGGIALVIAGRQIPNDERITKALTDIASFNQALGIFHSDNGLYPTTAEGLEALVTPPPNAIHWRQLLDAVKLDPWGHPYRYTFPGVHHPTTFDVSCDGPDGIAGNADDITN